MTDFTRASRILCLLITETDAFPMKILQNLSYQPTHPAGITAHCDIKKSRNCFPTDLITKKSMNDSAIKNNLY